ncbi:hypothetical protein EZS27_014269 [termite gut metagenome]|uniref:Uncharacterized protein n=1 Tax=termite gut metagenome TaxID=433724 RepID=A0A5J4RXG9_9ZZZZ
MNLHTKTQDFAELIQLTAKRFEIATEFVEKDYWITLILGKLSHSLI